jgi:hypothetical protein
MASATAAGNDSGNFTVLDRPAVLERPAGTSFDRGPKRAIPEIANVTVNAMNA